MIKRLKDKEGHPIGIASDNPILDTRMYEVEYADGYKAVMTENNIASNLFAQVDQDGRSLMETSQRLTKNSVLRNLTAMSTWSSHWIATLRDRNLQG